jgi:hypothetical protein
MPNDWFKYEEKVAETLSEFVSLILDRLKTPYLFRGHAEHRREWEARGARRNSLPFRTKEGRQSF